MQKYFINKYRELKVESHRGAQAACAETLYRGTPSKEELEKRWSELRNKEDWDDECEMCERPIMLHIGPCETNRLIRDNEYIYRDNEYRNICREWRWFKEIMNSIMKKDDEGEDFESTDEKGDENKIEIEEIEDEVVEIVQDLPNKPDPSADHSSYDDKTGLESVNISTYIDNRASSR